MERKKVAIVTGASAGLGKDFAHALIKEGMVVYAVARRVEKMTDLKKSGAITIKLDITKEADIVALVDTVKKEHGSVDVLVNNAGFGLFGSVEETTMEDARYQFDVNIFGLARLTQLVIPLMREQQSGKIINISSMGGKVYTPLGAWYHATKHALEGWSDCLRLELARFNVDVVVIEPGGIETEFGDVLASSFFDRSGSGPYAHIVNALKNLMGKRKGSPTDVITTLLIKAVRSKKPKTRYVAGKFAKPMLFIRKWCGDRFYDKTIMGMIR